VDRRGKEKKVYETWRTPYERLKSLKEWKKHLRPGVRAEGMEAVAMRQSDNDYARLMREAKARLFALFARP